MRLPLTAGLVHRPGGGINLNMDEEVQARLHLVFSKFRKLQSVKAVIRTLLRAGLPLPVRPLRGPAPQKSRSLACDDAPVCPIAGEIVAHAMKIL